MPISIGPLISLRNQDEEVGSANRHPAWLQHSNERFSSFQLGEVRWRLIFPVDMSKGLGICFDRVRVAGIHKRLECALTGYV